MSMLLKLAARMGCCCGYAVFEQPCVCVVCVSGRKELFRLKMRCFKGVYTATGFLNERVCG